MEFYSSIERSFRQGSHDPLTKGSGDDCRFVPKSALDEIMTQHAVRDLLMSLFHTISEERLNCILTDYVVVFAILLYLGRGTDIERFIGNYLSDFLLPFNELGLMRVLGDDSNEYRRVFHDFERTQWAFCVPLLSYGGYFQLNTKAILPFQILESFGSSGFFNIHKIKMYPEYNKLRNSSEDMVRVQPIFALIQLWIFRNSSDKRVGS
jgi:hypothetical protein